MKDGMLSLLISNCLAALHPQCVLPTKVLMVDTAPLVNKMSENFYFILCEKLVYISCFLVFCIYSIF